MGFIQKWKENRTLDSILRENKGDHPVDPTDVSAEVARTRMNRVLRRRDLDTLQRLLYCFPSVRLDDGVIQEAYKRFYGGDSMDSAQQLFDILQVEPEHPLSEGIVILERRNFKGTVVKKEVKHRPIIKDAHIVTFYLPEMDIMFRYKLTSQEFYGGAKEGVSYMLTIPILQRVNMLGHHIGTSFIKPSNLFFG